MFHPELNTVVKTVNLQLLASLRLFIRIQAILVRRLKENMAPLPWSAPFEKLDSTSCFEIVLSGSRSLNFLSILDKFWLTSQVTNRGKARLSGEPCLILLRICFHWICGGLRSGSLKRQKFYFAKRFRFVFLLAFEIKHSHL